MSETPTPPADSTPPAATPPKQEELPEWARKQISDANQEAANYRVQLRQEQETSTALREQVATLTTEKSGAASALGTTQSDFDKLATAVQTLLPDAHKQVFTFARTLQGSTEEELTAHAADLSSMFGISAAPVPATDPSQGHGSTGPANDPASALATFIQTSLSR